VRRHRSTLLLVAAIAVVVVIVAVVQGGVRTADPLDPDNPGPDGSRALARVLVDQGVQVTVARGAAELDEAAVSGATVVVTQPGLLGESTASRLLARTVGATRVVVAGAGPSATDLLGAPVAPSSVTRDEGRDAACADPLVRDLRLVVDRSVVYSGGGCFTGTGGAALVDGPGNLVLLGAEEALTNDQVLRGDNAALALRLLGQDERLVWYVPDPADLAADDGVSAGTLLPDWIRPGLFLLVLVVLALVLWRGRRLGALAVEPLPVVVTAAETTRSQGRLYRRSGDRAHAAATLRRATRARLGERLALGSAVPPDDVVRAIAAHTGRADDAVGALLAPDAPAPARDTDLITLAGDLAALEEEVRRG
jgi:hypothetical protein